MRNRAPEFLFAAISIVAFVGLLWLGSNLTFRGDEWGVILHGQDWSVDRLMEPHYWHWALGTRVTWNALQGVVGLGSYTPYLAVALVFHLAIAAGLFTLARRQVPAVIALAVGALFLLLGSGALGLQLAFQLGWNAAAAAGIWALVILLREPRPQRTWLGAVLLLVATLTWSSIGLLFVAAAGAVMILARTRRRDFWTVLPALVAFGAWYLAYGRETIGEIPQIALVQRYVIDGIANATGQVSGLGAEVGLVLAVLFAIVALTNLIGGQRLRLMLIAGSVGLVVQWLLLAWARAIPEPNGFVSTRYVYISAIFILMALIGLLAYRGWRRQAARVPFIAAVLAVFMMALTWNVYELYRSDKQKQLDALEHRAAIEFVATYAGTPAVPVERSYASVDRFLRLWADDDDPRSGPMMLQELVARYSMPLEDDPLAFRGIEAHDEPLDRLFAKVTTDAIEADFAELPSTPSVPTLRDAVGATTGELAGCLSVQAAEEPAHVDVAAPSGSDVYLWADTAGEVSLAVSLRGTFPEPGPVVAVGSGDVVRFGLPDIGPQESVLARVSMPAASSILLCGQAQPLP